jgi:hypothetical protein
VLFLMVNDLQDLIYLNFYEDLSWISLHCVDRILVSVKANKVK